MVSVFTKDERISEHATDALVIGLFEDLELDAELRKIDRALNDEISLFIKSKEFRGENGQIKIISTQRRIPAKKIVLAGLGKEREFTSERLRRISSATAKAIREQGMKNFSTALGSKGVQAVVEGIVLGLYDFRKYVTVEKNRIKTVDSATVLGKGLDKDVKRAKIISDAVCYVRDLVNEPASKVTPNYLAKEAEKLGKVAKVKVYGRGDIGKMGMGGLLAVSRGSAEEPKLIVIDYNGGKGSPIAFVGKGITFDSGGLDIKPAPNMEDMKCDMAGAATVIATIKAAQEMGIKKHIVGIIPTCENMVGSRSYHPGDIVTAYNGKTVEVTNTDAEGRLILMDALSYAEKNFRPEAIIDIATLTGASIIALGYEIVALMSADEKLKKKFFEASKKTGEMMWELPMVEDYKELMKGDIGDLRNSMKEMYGPGTITGGIFLSNFVEKTPWVHLDIGAAGWAPSDRHYKKRGGTGVCLRTFLQLLDEG